MEHNMSNGIVNGYHREDPPYDVRGDAFANACGEFMERIRNYQASVQASRVHNNDSGVGSEEGDGHDNTAPLDDRVRNYRHAYGRYWCPADYPVGRPHYFPVDALETARLGLESLVVYSALDGRLHISQFHEGEIRNVLDVGCGSGHWCVAMADTYHTADIHGIDLFPVQPTVVPLNCYFTLEDLEHPQRSWRFRHSFDFINVRGMNGSIQDWSRLYRRCYRGLRVGGWVELGDHDFRIRSDDPLEELAFPPSRVTLFNSYMSSAFNRVGKPINTGEDHEQGLRDTGFVNIMRETLRIPFELGEDARNGDLDHDPDVEPESARLVARTNARLLEESIPAWSWGFITFVNGGNEEYASALANGVLSEMLLHPNKRYFIEWSFVAAQRPNVEFRESLWDASGDMFMSGPDQGGKQDCTDFSGKNTMNGHGMGRAVLRRA